mmetsp:Transcript_120221/g.345574  ORF Transcript_120221/g.345574 Transcript_120221/m.345574 type:complete len:571 (+) Transcript_120221:2318-4030(+)
MTVHCILRYFWAPPGSSLASAPLARCSRRWPTSCTFASTLASSSSISCSSAAWSFCIRLAAASVRSGSSCGQASAKCLTSGGFRNLPWPSESQVSGMTARIASLKSEEEAPSTPKAAMDSRKSSATASSVDSVAPTIASPPAVSAESGRLPPASSPPSFGGAAAAEAPTSPQAVAAACRGGCNGNFGGDNTASSSAPWPAARVSVEAVPASPGSTAPSPASPRAHSPLPASCVGAGATSAAGSPSLAVALSCLASLSCKERPSPPSAAAAASSNNLRLALALAMGLGKGEPNSSRSPRSSVLKRPPPSCSDCTEMPSSWSMRPCSDCVYSSSGAWPRLLWVLAPSKYGRRNGPIEEPRDGLGVATASGLKAGAGARSSPTVEPAPEQTDGLDPGRPPPPDAGLRLDVWRGGESETSAVNAAEVPAATGAESASPVDAFTENGAPPASTAAPPEASLVPKPSSPPPLGPEARVAIGSSVVMSISSCFKSSRLKLMSCLTTSGLDPSPPPRPKLGTSRAPPCSWSKAAGLLGVGCAAFVRATLSPMGSWRPSSTLNASSPSGGLRPTSGGVA